MGKIEKWFREKDPLGIVKGEFIQLIREGKKIQKLESFLLKHSHGQLEVSSKTIKRYISSLPQDIQDERKRNLPKSSWNLPSLRAFKKVLTENLGISEPESQSLGCPHGITETFYDIPSERIYVRCKECGEILTPFGEDPLKLEKKQATNYRNRRIYESLRRKRS